MNESDDLLTCKVYQAESGQWSWQCYNEDGEAVAGGAGYESAEDAEEGAYEAMGVRH